VGVEVAVGLDVGHADPERLLDHCREVAQARAGLAFRGVGDARGERIDAVLLGVGLKPVGHLLGQARRRARCLERSLPPLP
jgi:hypothetical protein